MWTGRLAEAEMLHEHPLELADMKAGMADRAPEAATLRKRQMIYYPIAAIIAVALLFAVYGFVNGEQTAITTVPPQIATIPIYVPETPTPLPPTPTPLPSPTPAATAEATSASASAPTWAEVGPVFASKCGQCHGASASGGLNLSTYADALKGGNDGPVILLGDAANSKLFQLQFAGGHFGQLSAEELAIVKAWIDSGAVEK
jgi:mono/diheme cytochrome c family protein